MTPKLGSRGILIVTVAAVAALTWLMAAPAGWSAARLVYNPSDSVARGWYRITPIADHAVLRVGDIVLARLPTGAAALAARRGYLPEGVPLLKRVGAVAPQGVCMRGSQVLIDGVTMAAVLTHDRAQRPMQPWRACRALKPGELFLLSSTSAASFDSRYFGPIDASAVIGLAHPLWTWAEY